MKGLFKLIGGLLLGAAIGLIIAIPIIAVMDGD